MRRTGIREARRVARALVYRLGISSAEHIRIEAIAKRLGARVVETNLDGAQAQLVRTGDEVVIMVSDRITDLGSRRFSIAHELGHYVLKHPSMPPHALFGSGGRKVSDDERDYEAEANAFASELLMPHALLHRWCDVSSVDLDVPWRIVREFSVSILAAARRFTELSPERCAAVFSARRQVMWCSQSDTFTREIERGRRLEPASVAWDFFQAGKIDDRAQPVPADAWFETSADVEIIEHSIASEEHSTVLSMLWIPERVAGPLGMIAG
jgi:Zn-dependent peptidase ImmA (M78 family)